MSVVREVVRCEDSEVGGTNKSNFNFQIIKITTISSEKSFSTAGYTIFDRRNRLGLEVISELMFLNKNYYLL